MMPTPILPNPRPVAPTRGAPSAPRHVGQAASANGKKIRRPLSDINDPDSWSDEVTERAAELSNQLKSANAAVGGAWRQIIAEAVTLEREIDRDPEKGAALKKMCKKRGIQLRLKSPNADYTGILRFITGEKIGGSTINRYATVAHYLAKSRRLRPDEIVAYLKKHGLNETVRLAREEFEVFDPHEAKRAKASTPNANVKRAKAPSKPLVSVEKKTQERNDKIGRRSGSVVVTPNAAVKNTKARSKPLPAPKKGTTPTRNAQNIRDIESASVVFKSDDKRETKKYKGGTLREYKNGTIVIRVIPPRPAPSLVR